MADATRHVIALIVLVSRLFVFIAAAPCYYFSDDDLENEILYQENPIPDILLETNVATENIMENIFTETTNELNIPPVETATVTVVEPTTVTEYATVTQVDVRTATTVINEPRMETETTTVTETAAVTEIATVTETTTSTVYGAETGTSTGTENKTETGTSTGTETGSEIGTETENRAGTGFETKTATGTGSATETGATSGTATATIKETAKTLMTSVANKFDELCVAICNKHPNSSNCFRCSRRRTPRCSCKRPATTRRPVSRIRSRSLEPFKFKVQRHVRKSSTTESNDTIGLPYMGPSTSKSHKRRSRSRKDENIAEGSNTTKSGYAKYTSVSGFAMEDQAESSSQLFYVHERGCRCESCLSGQYLDFESLNLESTAVGHVLSKRHLKLEEPTTSKIEEPELDDISIVKINFDVSQLERFPELEHVSELAQVTELEHFPNETSCETTTKDFLNTEEIKNLKRSTQFAPCIECCGKCCRASCTGCCAKYSACDESGNPETMSVEDGDYEAISDKNLKFEKIGDEKMISEEYNTTCCSEQKWDQDQGCCNAPYVCIVKINDSEKEENYPGFPPQ